MRIKTEPARIACSLGSAAVPVPRPVVSASERFGLRFCGLLDRIRYRIVADDDLPHALHQLERLCRHFESRGVSAVEALVSELRRELVALGETGGAEPPEPEPAREELQQLTSRDRLEWARAARDSRARNAAVASRNAERRRDAARRTLLTEELRRIAAECEQLRTQWAETFAQRAAIYSRARHGLLGRRPVAVPAVPPYRHAPGLLAVTGAAAAAGPADPSGSSGSSGPESLHLVADEDRIA